MTTSPARQHRTAAPAFTLRTLRDLLAEMEQAHPEYGLRPVHAATIVAIRRIQLGDSGRVWWVQSECDPTQEYMVVPVPDFGITTCTCPDYVQRGGPCKHALAVQLLQACERREAERDAPPAPIPFSARAYSDNARFELTPLGEAALAGQEPQPAA